jgi:hypothetical protein
MCSLQYWRKCHFWSFHFASILLQNSCILRGTFAAPVQIYATEPVLLLEVSTHKQLCSSWRCLRHKGPKLHMDISTLKRPVLLLEVSMPQAPELNLVVSMLKRLVLFLEVSLPLSYELHLDVSTLQRPMLHLDLSTLHLDVSKLRGLICTRTWYGWITGAWAAPGHI